MTKSIWAGLIALLLVIACGIVEVISLNKRYEQMQNECKQMIEAVENESLDKDKYQKFEESWYELRETSELLLPHLDVYELNLRIWEARSYVEKEDYKSAHAQLLVAYELLKYIPHLMIPNFKHIV